MYSNQKAACGTYKKNDLTNLTPVQIISRLYQALDLDLTLARKAIIEEKRTLQGERLSHALAIIGELHANLNYEDGGEIAANLSDLYFYLTTEITRANLQSDVSILDKLFKTVRPLAETWLEMAANEKKEPQIVPARGGKPAEVARAVAFNATF